MLDISRFSQLPESVELDALLVLLEWISAANKTTGIALDVITIDKHDSYRIKERIRYLFSRKNQNQ